MTGQSGTLCSTGGWLHRDLHVYVYGAWACLGFQDPRFTDYYYYTINTINTKDSITINSIIVGVL